MTEKKTDITEEFVELNETELNEVAGGDYFVKIGNDPRVRTH